MVEITDSVNGIEPVKSSFSKRTEFFDCLSVIYFFVELHPG